MFCKNIFHNKIRYLYMIKALLNNWHSWIFWKENKIILLQHKNRSAQELIQSFQYHISNPVRSPSCIGAISGSIYSCVRVFGHQVNLGKVDPKSCEQTHLKQPIVFSSTFHIKWGLTERLIYGNWITQFQKHLTFEKNYANLSRWEQYKLGFTSS